MDYNKLSKDELLSKIEELERNLINSEKINERLVHAEEMAAQQRLILKFLNSMAIPSADKSTVNEFSEVLLKAVKEYTGAVLATFSYYQPDKKELLLLHIEAEQDMLKAILKIAGDKIVKTASPVDDETYEVIIKDIVGKCNTFTEVTFGAIPGPIDKAIRALTGIDRLYPVAHVIEGELYGTTMLAFKKGQISPSIELLESYAHLMSVSLRRYNAEKALKESEEKYRTIINTTNEAISVIQDGVFKFATKKMSLLLGVEAEKLTGKPFIDFVWPEDRELILSNYKRRNAGEKVPALYDFRIIGPNGTMKWVLVSVNITQWEGKQATIFMLTDITERKQAEHELIITKEKVEENEVKYRSLYENAPLPYQSLNEDGSFNDVNPAWLSTLGYKREEVIGKFYKDFLHPDWENHFEKNFPAFKKQGYISDVQFKIRHKKGHYLDISFEGCIGYHPDGSFKQTYCVFQDITDRKLSEIKLQESYNLLNNLTSMVPGVVYQYRLYPDGHSAFPFSSPGMYDIYEVTSEEVKEDASPVFTRIHPDDYDYVVETIKESAEKLTLYHSEFRVILPKQGLRWRLCDAKPEQLEDGSTLWYGIISDITDRKNAEEEIVKAKEKAEESEQNQKIQKEEIELNNARLESLLRVSQFSSDSLQELLDYALHEAIDLTNSKIGYIYFYNETTRQFSLNTWSKEVMKECEVMNPQTVYDLDSTGCWGEAVRQRKPIVINDYKAENPLKKGTPHGHVKLSNFLTIPVIFEKQIVAVAGVANKPTDYNNSDIRQLTLLMDNVWKISERVNLIENLKIAKEKAEESDRLKSAFLANMSHEIRTPMNGILGFTSLLKEPGLTGEDQQKFIDIIEKSGDRMLSTINDIIDISKIESGQVEVKISEINVNKQLDELLDFFLPEASNKNIKLSITSRVPDLEANFKSDAEKLNSILSNLIKNAIKYTSAGSIKFGCSFKDNQLEFYVKDTGIGIPKDRRKAVFDRFVQADFEDKKVYEGSGLGLAISKAYVEMLGGEIWVESEEGVGSQFHFTIPYAANEKKIHEKKIQRTHNR